MGLWRASTLERTLPGSNFPEASSGADPSENLNPLRNRCDGIDVEAALG
jgi:hypothetical protein